jgi:hypothetical protein
MIDEMTLQVAREEMEDMGMDEDSIDAALDAMQDAES